jgi:hypothetical protein
MVKDSKTEIGFHSDAWERFERAASRGCEESPQHRVAKKKTATTKRRKLKKKPSK